MSTCITSIEPDFKDPNIRHVYVKETCVASLAASEVKTLGFELGQQWTHEEEESVEQLRFQEKAHSIALQLLSRRAWSKKELATRLKKRGCEAAIAESIVDQLEIDGWLDDLAYAGACIREWIRVEPASRRWLTHKLSDKGVDQSTAALAIDEEIEKQSEQDGATKLAKIRISKSSSLDEETLRRRVIAAIQRRGFSSDIASEAFRRAT